MAMEELVIQLMIFKYKSRINWRVKKLINFNLNEVSEGRRHQGRRVRHRLISNAKARERLDWQPRYPSYRERYA